MGRTDANAAETGGITTVLFDVGGVLANDFVEQKTVDLANKHRLDPARLLEAKARLRPLADLGQITDPEFWARVLGEAGVEAREEDWEIGSYMEETPGMRGLVDALKRAGFRVAILSNDSREMARMRRQKFGFDERFDEVVISGEHGLMKPDPAFYRLALGRLGASPGECVFVDDRRENLDGAESVGIRTILFRDAEDLRSELRSLGLKLDR